MGTSGSFEDYTSVGLVFFWRLFNGSAFFLFVHQVYKKQYIDRRIGFDCCFLCIPHVVRGLIFWIVDIFIRLFVECLHAAPPFLFYSYVKSPTLALSSLSKIVFQHDSN